MRSVGCGPRVGSYAAQSPDCTINTWSGAAKGPRLPDAATRSPALHGSILNRAGEPGQEFRLKPIRGDARRTSMTRTPSDRAKQELKNFEPVAGNGLLDRRAWLRGGAALAGVMTGYTL